MGGQQLSYTLRRTSAEHLKVGYNPVFQNFSLVVAHKFVREDTFSESLRTTQPSLAGRRTLK